MAKIQDGVFTNWNDGDTINALEYKQERTIIQTAVNDNYDRLIKKYEVLLADGTVKSTQNLDTALNYIQFKEDSTITLVHDSVTSTLQLLVTDGSITTAKLTDLGVTTAKIADGNVTTIKLADGSVTTAKIADGAITNLKLASLSVATGNIQDLSITTAKLADLGVTRAKLSDSSVNLQKIDIVDLETRFYNETEIDNKLSNTAGGESYSFRKGTAFPTSPLEGDVFYRTDLDKPFSYTGVEWKAMESDLTETIATNRSQDRLLANHEAWFDVDGRATPNSGKYYDLLDGTNDLSIGLLDDSKGKSVKALTASTVSTKIQLDYADRPVTKFKAGQEVTIFDDVNLERQILSSAQEELITVDHSTPTRVSKKYDTSGNGGRKLVRLDTGALIVALKTTQGLILRKSTDNGLNWSTIKDYSTLSNSQQDVSLETDGVNIFTISARDNSTVVWYVFDENGNQKNVGTIESSQNALGNCSLTINSAGTELHASWASKNATYPNSFNIRYAKGTIASDGSVTWGTVEQLTTENTLDTRYADQPSIVINSSSNPVVVYRFKFNADAPKICASVFDGTVWSIKTIYDGTTHAQANPSVVFVPASVDGTINGTIHLAWHGKGDSTDTTKFKPFYSKSTDGGATWSAKELIVNFGSYDSYNLSITANSLNKLFVGLETYTSGNITYKEVRVLGNSGAGWAHDLIIDKNADTVDVSLLGDSSMDFDIPLFIYKNLAISQVDFVGKYRGYAPFLTVPSLINSYKVEATVARSSVIVDTVNKLLSFGGWKHTTTFDRSVPTTVVASAFDTSGNGGRKLVRLDNGWLVSASYSSSTSILENYVSKDNGETWARNNSLSHSGGSGKLTAIASYKNTVYWLYANSTTLYYYGLDYENGVSVTGGVKTLEAQDAIDSVSLTINDTGTELHASWASKNATYPNSFNIRYAKGTIGADGSVTWASPEQRTTANGTGIDYKNPSIIIKNDGYPFIAFDYVHTNPINSILGFNYDGTSWSVVTIYQNNGYTQFNPSAVVDGNGVIHVAWYGYDSVDTADHQIRYSKSTDGGATWSAMDKLTDGATSTGNQLHPSITRDKNNKIYIVWLGDLVDATNGNNIKMITNDGSGWSTISVLHESTTDNFIHPSTCANYFDFTQPLMIFMNNGSSVLFEGVWQDTDLVEIGVEDVRYNIDPSSAIDEAVAWVNREKTNLTLDGAISIVGSVDNESYNAMTKTTTEIDTTTDEDQFVGSVATANSKIALRLTLSRTDKTVKNSISKILGAVN
jgi:hypothetical protein